MHLTECERLVQQFVKRCIVTYGPRDEYYRFGRSLMQFFLSFSTKFSSEKSFIDTLELARLILNYPELKLRGFSLFKPRTP